MEDELIWQDITHCTVQCDQCILVYILCRRVTLLQWSPNGFHIMSRKLAIAFESANISLHPTLHHQSDEGSWLRAFLGHWGPQSCAGSEYVFHWTTCTLVQWFNAIEITVKETSVRDCRYQHPPVKCMTSRHGWQNIFGPQGNASVFAWFWILLPHLSHQPRQG